MRCFLICFLFCFSSLGARDFDGSVDFLEIGSAVVTSVPLTIVMWVNTNNGPPSKTLMQIADISEGNQRFICGLSNSANPEASTGGGGALRTATSTGNLTTGVWHHVACVFTTISSRSVYLDGSDKVTDTNTVTPTGLDVSTIGRSTDSTPDGEYEGIIGHTAVWNVALSDDEITTLASGISPLKVNRDNLVAYWPLNAQSPEPDIVGGLNLTLNGSPLKSEEPPIPYSIVAPGG